MNKYSIEVSINYLLTIPIEANDEDNAITKIREMKLTPSYKNSPIITIGRITRLND